MYEELWKKDGLERLAEIDKLKKSEFNEICSFHKSCMECPLAIEYDDKHGYSRLLCVDVSVRKSVLDTLCTGGKFLQKGKR